MEKLYSTGEVSKLVGVTTETVRNWETLGYIPKASRIGLRRKRAWNEEKLRRILEFASDNGYRVSPTFKEGVL